MKHKNILVLFLFTLSIDLAAQSIQNWEHLNLKKTIFDIKSTTSDKAGIGFMTKLDDKFRLIMDYSLLKDLLIENSNLSSISIKNMENQAYSTISIRAVYPPANLALLELDEYDSGFIEIGSEEDTPYFLVSPVQGKLDILNLTDMGLMETINTPSLRFMYSFLDSASVLASRSHSPVLNGKGQLISIALYDNETLKMMGLNKNEVKILYALEEVFENWAYKILQYFVSFLSYHEDKLYSDDKEEIGEFIDSGGVDIMCLMGNIGYMGLGSYQDMAMSERLMATVSQAYEKAEREGGCDLLSISSLLNSYFPDDWDSPTLKEMASRL